MALYQRIREIWKSPKENLGDLYRQRLLQWRREPSVVGIEKPTRLDRARELGYKAKKGYVMARVKVKGGGRMRPKFMGGRMPKNSRRKKVLSMNLQVVAEQRAQRKYTNLEVLNSYQVMNDSVHKWYEVIMVDPFRPEIKKDKRINWICARKHTNRVFRGRTSAGQKFRGLRYKGKGVEKNRPSLGAHKRLGN
ncbi:MAG: 50S ribosomal protein L15e [Nanoarchaeota archaeon]